MLRGHVATYFIGQVGSIFKGIGSMPVRGSASFQSEKPDEWRHNGDMKELTRSPLNSMPRRTALMGRGITGLSDKAGCSFVP
ncbi:hypothetical protein KSD_62780 [Ktedonobacter sp. SOSP1-85]|nr:hypothetical protein KSD_62780 [Ktedonobacter sp. SOSP1-85]